MKKLSILLLALAFVAGLAVPVMAGDVSMDGEYTLGGKTTTDDTPGEVDSSVFEHELDLNINVTEGDVTFHWDIELADTDLFDATGTAYYADSAWRGGDNPKGIWDGFYVKWQATDELSFKAGIYGVSDNNSLMFDSAGNQHGIMGLMYSVQGWDIAGYLAKISDNDEDDITDMFVTVGGELGPAEVSLVYGQETDEITDNQDKSSIYADASFGAGPVDVAIAYGSASNDEGTGDGGTILILDLGLEQLVGFDLTVTMIQTNEDWDTGGVFGNDYGYAKLIDYDEVADTMTIGLAAGYDVNDQLSLSALIVPMSDEGDAGDGPTEIDVKGDYTLADNVTYSAGYATVSAGDDTSSVPYDQSRLWHEINFTF